MNIIFILILTSLLVILLIKANKNTKEIKLNKVNVHHHLTTRPRLTILQLSDLHLENISISATELYEKLKDEPIDLIALTGDLLDRKRTIPKLVPYLKMLNKLKPRYGIYAVLGNHDYVLKQKDLQTLIHTLEHHNCKVLRNENDEIFIQGKRVNIIGIDDFSTNRSHTNTAYQGLKQGTNLVLTHDPNIVLHMQKYHFDYLLAGHFHGGQICYPKAYHLVKMGKLARMNIIKGFHVQDGKPYYISEGLGQTGVNIRIGSRPEITIHELSLATAADYELKAI
ncbi:metallophosphoesterase [Bacillus sp. B15-48]|uniref:metallophosphoesterase n=1 Tax=Bacillus sp. B15-48 TaxID=1548601 RepID=UPI001EF225D8|nr:metallophosphoesterase [Bacillus sp. B15-48]